MRAVVLLCVIILCVHAAVAIQVCTTSDVLQYTTRLSRYLENDITLTNRMLVLQTVEVLMHVYLCSTSTQQIYHPLPLPTQCKHWMHALPADNTAALAALCDAALQQNDLGYSWKSGVYAGGLALQIADDPDSFTSLADFVYQTDTGVYIPMYNKEQVALMPFLRQTIGSQYENVGVYAADTSVLPFMLGLANALDTDTVTVYSTLDNYNYDPDTADLFITDATTGWTSGSAYTVLNWNCGTKTQSTTFVCLSSPFDNSLQGNFAKMLLAIHALYKRSQPQTLSAYLTGIAPSQRSKGFVPNPLRTSAPTLPGRFKTSLPPAFDLRTDTSVPAACQTFATTIRDQGDCGGCWAFAVTDSLAMQACRRDYANGNTNVLPQYPMLSPQMMISCDTSPYVSQYVNDGCNGGDLQDAWNFATVYGVVRDTCMPYQDTTPVTCTMKAGYSPATGIQCNAGQASLTRTGTFAVQLTSEEDIMNMIYQYGPATIGINAYENLEAYCPCSESSCFESVYGCTEDIYTRVQGEYEGGHAVTLYGWGTDPTSGVDYWIMKNSWGEDWGMNGFAFVRRNITELGVTDYAYMSVYTGGAAVQPFEPPPSVVTPIMSSDATRAFFVNWIALIGVLLVYLVSALR